MPFCTHIRYGRRSRKGYVLLLVLVTLILASSALSQMAGRSLRAQVESLDAAQALQAKWGRISCEQFVLPRAARVFEAFDRSSGQAQADGNLRASAARTSLPDDRASLSQSVALGGMRFELLLADESAKADLNRVLVAGQISAVEGVLQDLVPVSAYRSVRVSEDSNARLAGWGNVFDMTRFYQLHEDDRALIAATKRVTLWGNGKLNIHRASLEAISAICSLVVPAGRADRIIETIGESPVTEVAIVLERAVKNKQEKDRLLELLGDASSTFSLWINAQMKGNQRSLSFVVRSVDESGRVIQERLVLR